MVWSDLFSYFFAISGKETAHNFSVYSSLEELLLRCHKRRTFNEIFPTWMRVNVIFATLLHNVLFARKIHLKSNQEDS